MSELVPIGRFSRMTRISVKALRHYQDVGLLEPAEVDSSSGYRYYRIDQAVRAETIRTLRTVDMPLDDIRQLLDADNDALAMKYLEEHRQRLLERVTDQERMIAYLERLIAAEGQSVPYDITIKEVSAQHVLATRFATSLKTVADDYRTGFTRLGETGVTVVGPPFAIFHDVIDDNISGNIELCFPLAAPTEHDGDPAARLVEEATVASVLHIGPYDEVSPAYHAITGWVQEHGHEFAGPPREIYLNDPNQVTPVDYLTEVQWPIK